MEHQQSSDTYTIANPFQPNEGNGLIILAAVLIIWSASGTCEEVYRQGSS
jgi:hypothetical protein